MVLQTRTEVPKVEPVGQICPTILLDLAREMVLEFEFVLLKTINSSF